jgi:hypothetical protein
MSPRASHHVTVGVCSDDLTRGALWKEHWAAGYYTYSADTTLSINSTADTGSWTKDYYEFDCFIQHMS